MLFKMFEVSIIAPTLLLYEWISKSKYWIIGIFGVVIFIIYITSIIRVILIEHKIKKLETERDKKIKKENSAIGVPRGLVERKIDHITAEYEPELFRLKRDRQYLLDKLPFIRK